MVELEKLIRPFGDLAFIGIEQFQPQASAKWLL
jgi:hypothetical protein